MSTLTAGYSLGGLLAETRTFRNRVQANGGTIEDGALEGLYDSGIQQAKSAGWYSDLVLFSAASAVEDVSGSIATMFDASGAQNDLGQSSTAARPTLDRSLIAGHWGALFDGVDDELTRQPVLESTWDVIAFSRADDSNNSESELITQYESGPNGRTILYSNSSKESHNTQIFNGDFVTGDTGADYDTFNTHRWRRDGTNGEVFFNGDSLEEKSGLSSASSAVSDFTIGSRAGSQFLSHSFCAVVAVNGYNFTDQEHTEIISLINNFYS